MIFNKLYATIIGVLIALLVLGGGAFYIHYLRAENAKLYEQTVTLEQSINTQKTTIENLQKDIKQITTEKKKIEVVKNENQKRLDELNKLFSRDGKSFDELAYAKPLLIENAINNGTKDKLRCFELITGQKVKDNEKNTMCSSFVN